MFENLLLAREAAVAVVTINRPHVLNALNATTLDELRHAIVDLAADDSVRAVIITGAGEKAFAAGADISELAGQRPDGGLDYMRRGQHVFDLLENMGKPVIAAISGFALGGGCELAMACTLRVAADSARFGQPEINLGLIPGFGGTQRLPRLVGPAKALEMNTGGEPISAAEAFEYGLVNRVVPDHELFDSAMNWAAKLARQAPVALERIKRVSHAADLDVGIEAEKQAFLEAFASEDAREGISAFVGKRTPEFKGK